MKPSGRTLIAVILGVVGLAFMPWAPVAARAERDGTAHSDRSGVRPLPRPAVPPGQDGPGTDHDNRGLRDPGRKVHDRKLRPTRPPDLDAGPRPLWVPIQTRIISGDGSQANDYAIGVGPAVYTAPTPSDGTATGYQVLLLDRYTLDPVSNQSFPASSGSDVTSMANAMTSSSFTSGCGEFGCLMVVQSLNGFGFTPCVGQPGNCSGLPGSLFQALGGSPQINYACGELCPVQSSDTPEIVVMSRADYSLIANIAPGSSAGSGGGRERLTCLDLGNCGDVANADDHGAISGVLILDNNAAYTFAPPGRVTFSTGTGASATSNTITIGSTAYPSATIPAGSGAFQVVIVDGSTLELLFNGTFNFTQLYSDDPDVQTMYQVLTGAARNENRLVFISSVGTDMWHGAWPVQWSRVAQAVAGLGGTYQVFLSIQRTDDYALVGRGSPYLNTGFFPYRGTEVSTVITNAIKPAGAPTLASNLRGVLARDNRGFYTPVLSNRTSTFDQTTLGLVDAIALQPPTPWPAQSPGQQAAYTYISEILLGSTAPDPDIRAAYTNENQVPSTWLSILLSLSYPSGQSFTESDFDSVQAQLETEIEYVSVIRQFLQNIEDLYTQTQTGVDAILNGAYQAVKNDLQPGGGTGMTPRWQSVIAGAETISDDIGSLAGGPAVKLALDLVFVSANFAMAAANATGGAALQRVETTFDGLQQRSIADFAASLTVIGNLFDLILTDWGRLQALGVPLKGNQIVWDPSLNGAVLDTLDRALRRQYLLELIPPGFEMGWWTDVAEGAPPQPDRLCCKYAAFPCGIDCLDCDVGGSDSANWIALPTSPTGNSPAPGNDGQNYDILVVGGDVRCSANHDGGLLDPLFAPLDPNDPTKLGLFKPYFFIHATMLRAADDPPFSPLRLNDACYWSPSQAPCVGSGCCFFTACASWGCPCSCQATAAATCRGLAPP
jgi:hypothetical protein